MESIEVTIRISPSGVIAFDSDACSGCGICELMCALYHEGVGGPARARLRLDRDPLNAEFSLRSCRQCLAPGCYVACPLSDDAFRICERTGARYVEEDECTGCGECIDACPFEPSRVKLDEGKDVAVKCDLCRDREAGPICVEYCPVGALEYVPGSER